MSSECQTQHLTKWQAVIFSSRAMSGVALHSVNQVATEESSFYGLALCELHGTAQWDGIMHDGMALVCVMAPERPKPWSPSILCFVIL